MNLYQKLIEVRKVVPYLQKEKSGNQYQYVGSSQVLSAVKNKLDELQILLIPRITGHNVTGSTIEQHDKEGNVFKRTTTYFTELDMDMMWLNAEKPDETVVCPWYGQGVDIAGEKGVGKALTYAEKYFMLKFFNIPTDKDDPDAFQDKLEPQKAQPAKPAPFSPPGTLAASRLAAAKAELPQEKPVDMTKWWTQVSKLGLGDKEVHDIAGRESLKGMSRAELTELFGKCKVRAAEIKEGA